MGRVTEAFAELQEQYIADCLGEPQCMTCIHAGPGNTCAAFPEGIPGAIVTNVHDHTQPYERDMGVRYERAT